MNIQSQPAWLGKTSARFLKIDLQRVKLIACNASTTPSQSPRPAAPSLPASLFPDANAHASNRQVLKLIS